MIDATRWTRAEREVIVAALLNYRTNQARNARHGPTLPKRRNGKANEYVAGDVLRQILDR